MTDKEMMIGAEWQQVFNQIKVLKELLGALEKKKVILEKGVAAFDALRAAEECLNDHV